MTDNIVSLKPTAPTPPRIWTCAHCDSQNFFLYEDGVTECALCGVKGADGRGNWIEPLNRDPDYAPDTGARQVVSHGTADFAKAATLKAVDDETCLIALAWPNGRLKVWSTFNHESPDDDKQLLHRLGENVVRLTLGEPALPDLE